MLLWNMLLRGSALRGAAPEVPAEENRRSSARYPARRRGTVRAIALQPTVPWDVEVLDVSREGIGLLLKGKFEGRPEIGLFLALLLKGFPRPLRVQIVRATRVKKGRWVLGCRLAGRLRVDELQALTGTAPGR